MKNELIIRITEEGTTIIEADDKKIGLVQSLKLEVQRNGPNLKISFPRIPEDSNSPVKGRVAEYIEAVKKLPYCTVNLIDIETENNKID